MACIFALGGGLLVVAVTKGATLTSLSSSDTTRSGHRPSSLPRCSHYRGRGAFESMGAGIPMAPGDIAFKCNFATLDPDTGIVTSRRADRHFEHVGPPLCRALDGEAGRDGGGRGVG
jgi:hypothetical protein